MRGFKYDSLFTHVSVCMSRRPRALLYPEGLKVSYLRRNSSIYAMYISCCMLAFRAQSKGPAAIRFCTRIEESESTCVSGNVGFFDILLQRRAVCKTGVKGIRRVLFRALGLTLGEM